MALQKCIVNQVEKNESGGIGYTGHFGLIDLYKIILIFK